MQLAATICQYGQHDQCPSHPPPTYMQMFNPPQVIHKILNSYLGSFVTTLLEVGEVTSIFVAIYLLLGLARCVYFYLKNLLMLTKIHGPSLRIFSLACPEIMSAFTYRMATTKKMAVLEAEPDNQETLA